MNDNAWEAKMTFVSSKFCPENDPDRPKVGDTVEDGRVIKKVDWMLYSDALDGKEPDPMEGCVALMKEHTTRAVIWIVWVKND